MVLFDVLLACNLIAFAICAIRAPRASRPRLDDLIATAHLSHPASSAPGEGARVIAFPTREEMEIRRARAAHPSTARPPVARPSVFHPAAQHPAVGHRSLGHS